MKRLIAIASIVTVGFVSEVTAESPAFYFKNNTDRILDIVVEGKKNRQYFQTSIKDIQPYTNEINKSIQSQVYSVQIRGCKPSVGSTQCAYGKEALGTWKFYPKDDTKKYYIKFYVDKKMGKYVLEPQTGGLKGLRNQTTGKIDGQKIRYSLSGNIKKIVQQ